MANKIWTGAVDNSYSVAGNWIGGVPVATDNVYLTTGYINSINAGLNQSGVAITSFNADLGYTGSVADSGTYLQINSTNVILGKPMATGNASGSGRMNLNFGSVATTVNVYGGSTNSTDLYQTCYKLLGTSISQLSVLNGQVGVALDIGSVSGITSVTIDGGYVVFGPGVGNPTFTLNSGILNSATTATVTASTINGIYNYSGTGAHTTMNILGGGYVNYTGSGTIDTLNITGNLDLSNSLLPFGSVTVNFINRFPGGSINDPNGVLAIANWITDVGGATLLDNKSTFGPNRTYIVT